MERVPVSRKNPLLATALSLVFTGAGQLYNGQIVKGGAYVVLYGIAWLISGISLTLATVKSEWFLVLVLTAPAVWVWGILDANRSAKRVNEELAATENERED